MTKPSTKPKEGSKAGPATNLKADPKEIADTPKEELVVFAFRLTAEERDLIHKAAGPAKASRFVRTLVVAGALGDRRKIAALLGVEPPEIK
jgi:hypothetical protein